MAARKTQRSRKTSTRKKMTGKTSQPRKGVSSRKTSGRKDGPKARKKVRRAMHEMKRGELRSGRSKKKVTSRKQAIAIGLSEARRAGAKVPARKRSSRKK